MKQSECCSAVAIRCGKTLDRKGGRDKGAKRSVKVTVVVCGI